MTTQPSHERLKELRPDIHGALLDWVRFGITPDNTLLNAALHNHLQRAIAYLEPDSLEDYQLLRALVQTLHNYIPGAAWSTHQYCKDWQAARGKEPLPNFTFGD